THELRHHSLHSLRRSRDHHALRCVHRRYRHHSTTHTLHHLTHPSLRRKHRHHHPTRGQAPHQPTPAATRRSASSTSSTPATHAATYPPTLWPSTSEGSTPQLRHSSASDHASANRAGCVYSVRSSNPPPPPPGSGYSTSRSGTSSSPSSTAAQRSSALRNTGELSYSSRPIPAYCDP